MFPSRLIRISLCCTSVALTFGLPESRAADRSWVGPARGEWGDAANWSGGVVPGESDTAILSGPITVSLVSGRTVGGLMIDDAATLLIEGKGNEGASLTVNTSWTNRGTVRLTNSSTLDQTSSLFQPAGVTMTNIGTFELLPGIGGGVRQLTGSFVNLGAFTVYGGVSITSGATFEQRDGVFTANGLLAVSRGAFRYSGGSIAGANNIELRDAGLSFGPAVTSPCTILVRGANLSTDVPACVTLDVRSGLSTLRSSINRGTIRLVYLFNSTAGQLIVGRGTEFTNVGLIETSSDVDSWRTRVAGYGTWSNEGVIRVHANGPFTNQATFTNRGSIEIEPGGSFLNEAIMSNVGTIVVARGGTLRTNSTFSDFKQGDGRIIVDGLCVLAAGNFLFSGGSIEGSMPVFARGATVSFAPSLPAPWTLIVDTAGTKLASDIPTAVTLELRDTQGTNPSLQIPRSVTSFGTIRMSNTTPGLNAILAVSPGAKLVNAGTFDVLHGANGGNRAIKGSVRNEGTVRVRSDTSLTVTGGWVQSVGASTIFEIASDTEFSQLQVNGPVVLDGRLRVSRLADFDPAIGRVFPILRSWTLADRLSCGEVDGLAIPPDRRFNLRRTATDLALEVVAGPPLAADTDCDCKVDLVDLARVLRNFGTTAGMQRADGDLDGDGAITLDDLTQLLAAFGEGCG